MKHDDVLKMMEEMGLPFAYDHFVEGESPYALTFANS